MLPGFKPYYKAIVIKTVQYDPKTESPEINPHTYGQSICDKSSNLWPKCGKNSLCNKWCWEHCFSEQGVLQLCWCHTGPWKVGWGFLGPIMTQCCPQRLRNLFLSLHCGRAVRCAVRLSHTTCWDILCVHFCTVAFIFSAFCPGKGEWLPSTPGPSPFKHTWLNSFCHCYHKWPWAWWLEITEGYYSLIVLEAKVWNPKSKSY